MRIALDAGEGGGVYIIYTLTANLDAYDVNRPKTL